MDDPKLLEAFDKWLVDKSDCAALTFTQVLEPVQGPGAVVFPPTYTLSNTDAGDKLGKGTPIPGMYQGPNGPIGYNIDQLPDGTTVCQIDSVGSQANRMEPLFMRKPLSELVPQVTIAIIDSETGEEKTEVNLLKVGHRIADAVVRFSDLKLDVDFALRAFDAGAAEALAKLAPTSIVFGVWDSRGTQVKIPRIVRSVILAYDVHPLHRSAQYIPPVDYRNAGVVDKSNEKLASEFGMTHVPAPWTHGGVLVRGDIRREAVLSLERLRSIEVQDETGQRDDAKTMTLRRYILGLSLAALTARQPVELRQGCELTPKPGAPDQWQLVRYNGTREGLSHPPAHDDACKYAKIAANKFGVGPAKRAVFSIKGARKAMEEAAETAKAQNKNRKGTGVHLHGEDKQAPSGEDTE